MGPKYILFGHMNPSGEVKDAEEYGLKLDLECFTVWVLASPESEGLPGPQKGLGFRVWGPFIGFIILLLGAN